MVGSLQNAQNKLKSILQTGVTSVDNRVYLISEQPSSRLPRITISTSTPEQNWVGLGNTAATPKWHRMSFRVTIWNKKSEDPHNLSVTNIDAVADQVCDAVGGNPTAIGTSGRFYFLKVSGGGDVFYDNATQLWCRTLNVSGTWLQEA